jgi:beta-phosphoglucomutase
MTMRGVIFDFDGVLVDSEPLHFRSLRDSLRPEGVTIDEDEYERYYLAYDDREAIRIALERHDFAYEAERIERVASRKALLLEAMLPEIPFFPGAIVLVGSLSRLMPLAIASGALRMEIERILSVSGMLASFKAIVGADDVSRCKPDPEPFLTAMKRLAPYAPGLKPSECLVLEDSLAGITAARSAGMKVVGVAHSYPKERLSMAHRVIESLLEADIKSLQALFMED